MKRFMPGLILVVLFADFCADSQKLYPHVRNTNFGVGERIDYRVNFGIFTVGHATTQVDKGIFMINSRPCYKIDAFGRTSGLVSWLNKVDDQWGAFVDTSALVTHVSYRKIKEGRFRKDEIVNFDFENRKAEVKLMNNKTGTYDNIKYYPVKQEVRDLVAGFTYLRVIDYNQYKKGDTLAISGFFEDNSYILKIIYDGKETVVTDVGSIICRRLIPIVPDNKLFDGENSITVWVSDDGNQIPVKIQARMFIGSTGLELESFRGLRNQVKIVQKE